MQFDVKSPCVYDSHTLWRILTSSSGLSPGVQCRLRVGPTSETLALHGASTRATLSATRFDKGVHRVSLSRGMKVLPPAFSVVTSIADVDLIILLALQMGESYWFNARNTATYLGEPPEKTHCYVMLGL